MDPDLQASFGRSLRAARLVGASLLASLLLELAAVEIVRALIRPFFGLARLGAARIPFRYAVYAGAAAAVVLLRLLNAVRPGKAANPAPAARLRRLAAIAAASLSLAEIPAVLGLVLFLAGGYNRDFYALFAASLVLLFMYFPRASVWEARLEGEGGSCPF